MKKKVYFIGAGPGDPELITVKGARIIAEADVVVYAGSLVNREVLATGKDNCIIHDSAGMTLEEVTGVLCEAVEAGQLAARVHTGDPSLFGAIREQIDILEGRGIECEIIPGVSSFAAAAATIRKELTLPGVSQTVILTRLAGRTPVPEREALRLLAAHQSSLIIFLSIHDIDNVVKELLHGYREETPAAVVYKASWPEQQVITGTLADISDKVKEAAISKTALIMVGNFMGNTYELSKLYDKNFSHGFRSENRNEALKK